MELLPLDTILLLKLLSGATWLANLGLLIAPVYRIVTGQRRYLDPLWVVVLIGVANRLMFVSGQVPLTLSYLAAILLACVLFLAMWSYQNADA